MKTIFKLCHKGGIYSVPVDFNPVDMKVEYNRRLNEAIKAERAAIQDQTQDAHEKYALALLELYEIVFGHHETEVLCMMYAGDLVNLLSQVKTFLQQKIEPAIRKAEEKKKREALKKFRRERRKVVNKK